MSSSREASELFEDVYALELIKQSRILSDGKELPFADTSEAWKFLRGNLTAQEQKQLREQETGKKSLTLHTLSSFLDDANDDNDDVSHMHILESVNISDIDHLRLRYIFNSDRDSRCSFCKLEDCRHGGLHDCRICDRIYHEECLRARGCCNDEHSMEAIACSIGQPGWSCPECENLFSLLSDQEKDKVMDIFESVAGEDGVIDLNEFIKMQKEDYRKLLNSEMPQYREQLERELFAKIDRDSTGAVEWWDFMPHMTIRMLGRRSTKDLLLLLTAREVDTFKRFYLAMDLDGAGAIPQSRAKKSYINWYTSLVKLRAEINVDKSWYGGDFDFDAVYSGSSIRTYDRYISWDEYLQKCALQIVAARPNTVYQKPFIPAMPTFLYAQACTSSFDYEDIAPVDEYGEKCDDVTMFIKAKLARNAKENEARIQSVHISA